MISLKSYPKINLALDILNKDASGYHEIKTVFHMLTELFDELIIEDLSEDRIEIGCDNPALPLDDTNIVLKAAKLLKKHTGTKKGAKIFIKKRIPLMSGLGGGSSNAVAALKGLATLWAVKDPQCLLRKVTTQIGMDCAFFLDGGTALGEHFGETITPLPTLPLRIKFEIIDTDVEVSSHFAYSQIDLRKCGKNAHKTEQMLNAINGGDINGILKNLHNDFEDIVFEKYPKSLDKKREMESLKGGHVLLCGSGGALVRVYS
ncbi:MAG: 4-(cytidine 5'-diphospho)-2-C-methyl-D-erythritol kinase [Patescibacteria group bacterium]